MAGLIPENIIEEILGRIDIVELISAYFPLKRAGRNFKTTCPFHKEKTPSFMVSPDKQIFHCFGCNEGGNSIHFLMKYERLEFPEAVRALARRAGVIIPEVKNKAEGTLGLYKINNLALQFYQETLRQSGGAQTARLYLKKRSLNEETINKFKLGFAPAQGETLVNFLRQKEINLELVRNSGLIVRREAREGFFDFFRGRIIYPIFDIRERVVGFGGRVMDESLPKYINSPESSIYKKGEMLYGLNFSRETIRGKGFAIVVEGYMDLIMLFQAGFHNIVATLGTALTSQQARLLKRFASSVVVVYDGDKAGEMASLRGLEIFLEEGLDVKLVALPEELDPDSFLRLKGRDEFETVLKGAQNLFAYRLGLLSREFDMHSLEGKMRIIKEILPTISKVENMVLRAEFIKQVAEVLSVSQESLWIELQKLSQGTKVNRKAVFSKQEAPGESAFLFNSVREAEAVLVKLMLEEKSFVNRVKQALREEDFVNPQVRKVVGLLYASEDEGKSVEPSRLVNVLQEDSSNQVLTRLLMEDISGGHSDMVFEDCVKKIKEDNRRRICQNLKAQLEMAQKEGDSGRAEELLREFNSLVKQRF
jgi:DNA primase